MFDDSNEVVKEDTFVCDLFPLLIFIFLQTRFKTELNLRLGRKSQLRRLFASISPTPPNLTFRLDFGFSLSALSFEFWVLDLNLKC